MLDIVPDIHGHAATLRAALEALGYRERGGAFAHPSRRALLLGDLIDRGPDSAGVIAIVRAMVEAGQAMAVMGNHELNALHFHTVDPESGRPLRSHAAHHVAQHEAFLAQFPPGEARTREALDWMATLPLFLEVEGCRAVHACWDADAVERLRARFPDGRLDDDAIVEIGRRRGPLFEDVETLTKGVERDLPQGFSFADKGGHERRRVRLRWWADDAPTWRDGTVSVPPEARLPEGRPDMPPRYPADAPPVFFGHYWLSETPGLEAPNALCLDYSVGLGGPLVTYVWDGATPLDASRLNVHPNVG